MTKPNTTHRIRIILNSVRTKILGGAFVFFFILFLTSIDTVPVQGIPVDAVGIPNPAVSLTQPLPAVSFAVMQELPMEQPKEAPGRSEKPGNTYERLQCTWWAKEWRKDIPNTWSHAKNWGIRAKQDGWTVSDKPIVGAIAWSTRGQYGHVAIVLKVFGDSVEIKEGNYDYNGSVRIKIVAKSTYQYIY